MHRFAALALLGFALVACRDQRPPAPTEAENQQLDAAGAMLDNLAADEPAPAPDANAAR